MEGYGEWSQHVSGTSFADAVIVQYLYRYKRNFSKFHRWGTFKLRFSACYLQLQRKIIYQYMFQMFVKFIRKSKAILIGIKYSTPLEPLLQSYDGVFKLLFFYFLSSVLNSCFRIKFKVVFFNPSFSFINVLYSLYVLEKQPVIKKIFPVNFNHLNLRILYSECKINSR